MADQMRLFEAPVLRARIECVDGEASMVFDAPELIRRNDGSGSKQATSHTRRGPRWLNPKVVARMTPEQREEHRDHIKQEGQENG